MTEGPPAEALPQLVLVGGGHAHIQVLADFALSPPPCALTIVVDRPRAMYSGMVPGFVAGQYEGAELTLDIEDWAARVGARLVLGKATGFDGNARLVHLADGDPLPYDLCSFNIGSTVLGGDVPGVAEHALATRPIGDFVGQVGERLAAAVAARGASPLRLLIVGGGAAGVELALCMQVRARAEGASDVQVSLISAADQLLPGSPTSLRRRIERELSSRAVAVRCGCRVTEVAADCASLDDGTSAPADLVAWVTGAAAHFATEPQNSDLTPRGWIPVRSTLQHSQHDELFAVGDCAELIDHPHTA